MRQKDYQYTGSQCESKFKNLKQNYTRMVDHNNVSGNNKKTCPYFEELSKIFGMTPCVKPIAVCCNRATSPASGFEADACSSIFSGGGLWTLLCKHCRQTMNLFPLKRKNAREKGLHKVRKVLLICLKSID